MHKGLLFRRKYPTQKYKDGFSKTKIIYRCFPKAQALLALYIERILSADRRDNMASCQKWNNTDNIFSRSKPITYEFPPPFHKKEILACSFFRRFTLYSEQNAFADDFIFPIQQIEKIPVIS